MRLRYIIPTVIMIVMLMGAVGFFDQAAMASCINKGYSASECHHIIHN